MKKDIDTIIYIRKRKNILMAMILLSIVFTVGFAVKATEFNQIILELDQEIKSVEQEIVQERAKLEELIKEQEKMTSIEYIEKTAREKLGMVKEHDIVFEQK